MELFKAQKRDIYLHYVACCSSHFQLAQCQLQFMIPLALQGEKSYLDGRCHWWIFLCLFSHTFSVQCISRLFSCNIERCTANVTEVVGK